MSQIIVLCSTPINEQLSEKIISEKLAACVNKIPEVESTFLWKGKINKEKESLLVIKTTMEKYEELEKFIKENHPYECPEIIYFKIDGYTPFLNWITDSLKKEP